MHRCACASRLIVEALESAATLYLASVVLGELYYGAFRSAFREKQLEQIRRFLRAVVALGTDAQKRSVDWPFSMGRRSRRAISTSAALGSMSGSGS